VRALSKAERSSEKLEKAQGKLPAKRRVRSRQIFDEQKGKPKRGIYFEQEAIPRREHLKGPTATRPAKAIGNAAVAYGHRKLYQAEHENVAVKAAHRGEALAETGLRGLYRHHKTAPYQKVERLTGKTTKLKEKADFRQTLHDNPKLKSNHSSHAAQKRKIKKQYAKTAREAKKSAGRVKESGNIVGRAASSVGRAAARHPLLTAVICAALLLLFLISALFASCSNMGSGAGSAVMAATYLAGDADTDGAELLYTELETDMQLQIMNAERDRPGYDEYRYSIDDISHSAYELMACLTARFHDFTMSSVDAELRSLFAEQYQLVFAESTETRYRTVVRTDPDTGERYEEQEPYDWRVLTITLTARSFTDVAAERMDAEQLRHYGILMQTKGGRQYAGNPLGFGWIGNVSSAYGWRVHPATGAKDYHKGVDIAVPAGTDVLAANSGTISIGYDAGGYGNYVTLTGSDGLVTKYAHLGSVIIADGQEVKAGDIIAKSGNTGRSTGPHLHFEVLRNGIYLNPLIFSDTGGYAGPVYGDAPAPMGGGSYAALLAEAERHLGKPYVFGAAGPDSFDCSGFISVILRDSGVKDVGRLGATALYNVCTPVIPGDARPGDLVFFEKTYSSATNPISHVGLYVGMVDGHPTMVHFGNPGKYARIDTAYWQTHFVAFGRVNP
jgi:murein DD-endopeptidase MepM/ murein hydrolase activator NlpD